MINVEIDDPKVMRLLFEKNSTLISWLELVVNADCSHVGYENVAKARARITSLQKENERILDGLSGLAQDSK